MTVILPFGLWTARYHNPLVKDSGHAPVRITLGSPRMRLGYALAGEIRELAPPGYLFKINERAVFEPKFFAHLDEVGIERIAEAFTTLHLATSQDLVLLCFERVDQGDWCHRLCVAKWWEARTGQAILELPEPEAPAPQTVLREKGVKVEKGGKNANGRTAGKRQQSLF
jgi:hypothetical protein